MRKYRSMSIAAVALMMAITGTTLFTSRQGTRVPTDPAHSRWTAMREAGDFDHFKKSLRKTRGVIFSSLRADTDRIEAGRPFHLVGTIEMNSNAEQVRWIFRLPEGLRLLAGETEGFIEQAKNKTQHEFSIEVVADKISGERIQFVAWKMENGEAIGNSANYYVRAPASLDDSSSTATGSAFKATSSDSYISAKSPAVPAPPRSTEEFLRRAIQ